MIKQIKKLQFGSYFAYDGTRDKSQGKITFPIFSINIIYMLKLIKRNCTKYKCNYTCK